MKYVLLAVMVIAVLVCGRSVADNEMIADLYFRYILPRLPAHRRPVIRLCRILRAFAAVNRTSHVVIEKWLAMTRATPVPIEHSGTNASFRHGGRTAGIWGHRLPTP
jgi:hypothetical protein